MKEGRSLNELIVELERQHNAKADFIAPASGTKFEELGWKVATMDNGLWEQVNGQAYML